MGNNNNEGPREPAQDGNYKHSVDLRFITPRSLGGMYFDLRVGRDTRDKSRSHSVPGRVRRMNRVVVAMASQMAVAWCIVVGLAFYWGIQSGCGGIDMGGPVFDQPSTSQSTGPTGSPDVSDTGTQEPTGLVRMVLRLPGVATEGVGTRLLPSATTLVRLTVSASDLSSPAVATAPVTPETTVVTLSVEVKAGPNRQLLVEALGENDEVLASGSALVDVVAARLVEAGVTLSPEASTYPSVVATASPSPALVGETVTFGGSASDSNGSIDLYAWDFNGDGVFNWSDAASPQTTFTYQASGTYAATLKVVDNDGLSSEGTVEIVIQDPVAPSALASASPSPVGLGNAVTFSGVGTDVDGSIVKYEWDFETDGTYDWSNANSASTTHTYPSVGTYTATLRVTDDQGLTATDTATIEVTDLGEISVVIDPNETGEPVIDVLTITPTPAQVNQPVSFGGTARDSDGSIVNYEWDFNGDGSFDWAGSTSPATTHTYTNTGSYSPVLRVTDDDGLSAQATATVVVE